MTSLIGKTQKENEMIGPEIALPALGIAIVVWGLVADLIDDAEA